MNRPPVSMRYKLRSRYDGKECRIAAKSVEFRSDRALIKQEIATSAGRRVKLVSGDFWFRLSVWDSSDPSVSTDYPVYVI